MSIIGDLQELLGQIYPYRWAIAVAVLLIAVGLVVIGRRRGWHRTIGRHPRRSATVAAVALVVLLAIGWYLGSPLWTRTELVEASPLEVANAVPGMVLARGEFRGADAFHFAEGRVQVVETAPGEVTLRFEDFSIRNGPDLHVYLSPSADGYTDDALDLGELKATDGAFNYDVPTGTDLSQYRSVVVWCVPFEVLFAVAPLA